MSDLDQASAKDAGKLYLEQMVQHHKGAVDMAKTEVDKGKNTDASRWRSRSCRARPSRSPRCRTCSRPSKPRRGSRQAPPSCRGPRPAPPSPPARLAFGHPTFRPTAHPSWSLPVPQQHPQTPTIPAPRTRREALAAERRRRSPDPPAAPEPRRPLPLPGWRCGHCRPSRLHPQRRSAHCGRAFSPRSRSLVPRPRWRCSPLPQRCPRRPRPAPRQSCPVSLLPPPGRASPRPVALAVDRDGYAITKPAPKPVITKTAPASQAASTGGAPASTKQSVPTTTAARLSTPAPRHSLARRRNITVSSPFGPRSAPCGPARRFTRSADLTTCAAPPSELSLPVLSECRQRTPSTGSTSSSTIRSTVGLCPPCTRI